MLRTGPGPDVAGTRPIHLGHRSIAECQAPGIKCRVRVESAVLSSEPTELQKHAAHNESRYRALNERMEPHNAVHVWVNPPMPDWVCECASQECMKPVRMTLAEYEAVRAEPTHFFVIPNDGHLSPAVERIVERYERYWVVEKVGEAAEASVELDPRSD